MTLGLRPCQDELSEELFEVRHALLAQVLDARAEGGQAGSEGGKKRSCHISGGRYTALLTSLLDFFS